MRYLINICPTEAIQVLGLRQYDNNVAVIEVTKVFLRFVIFKNRKIRFSINIYYLLIKDWKVILRCIKHVRLRHIIFVFQL